MTCAHCRGIEEQFGARVARWEMLRYRRLGPPRATRLLLRAIREATDRAGTLLDIGGGVGALQHELLDGTVERATSVDASSAYLAAARQEAERRGVAERIDARHGDFLDIEPALADADVVTLDRVICCYPDMPRLVERSAARARRLWGAVYPRSHPINRIGVPLINGLERIRGIPFRVFLHEPAAIAGVLTRGGLVQRMRRRTLLWEMVLWERR
jgi:hypothetical protein